MSQRTYVEPLYTVDSYFGLVRTGALDPDDRVELLEGVIVAEPPQNPRHASGITRVDAALRAAVGQRAVIREQSPFIAGHSSVPEPDVAVVPGRATDYDDKHPTAALLVVEVADTSLRQDRLSKARIYAAAGVPEYWLVNLQDDCVEVFRAPDVEARQYAQRSTAHRYDRLDPIALPGASVAVDDLIPTRPQAT